MRRLLLLIYNSRVFFLFLILEVICAFLVVRNNRYKNATWFNSANTISANIYERKTRITDYIGLYEKDKKISEAMAKLLDRLVLLKAQNHQLKQISASIDIQYRFVPAKVINNSLYSDNNYITIDKGSKDGIKSGMGVISSDGIVGKVKGCSENFSTVESFLHSNTTVSSKFKKNNVLCTSSWDGTSYKEGVIKLIPRHIKANINDTIVTSGYNAVYPEGVIIGMIKSKVLEDHHNFHETSIALGTDFSSLEYVYVVENTHKEEQQALEKLNDK